MSWTTMKMHSTNRHHEGFGRRAVLSCEEKKKSG